LCNKAYKLLQKHFTLKPYNEFESYKWAFATAEKIYRKQEFMKFMMDNLKIHHVFSPSFIHVLNLFKVESKSSMFYLLEKSIKLMIDYINQYANNNPSSILFTYTPTSSYKDIYQNQNKITSYLSPKNANSINLENKKEINYYYSLCCYYIKRYIEFSVSEEYLVVSNPLEILPSKMNPNLFENYKCLSSALVILHLLNYNKKHYKYQHPEIYFPLISLKYKNKLNLHENQYWMKCAQYCQQLNYLFLDEYFGFSNNIKKFQNLIRIMESVELYEEAFTYVNWMYDTLNVKSTSPYNNEFKYSRRRRKIVNYNEFYSDEDSNDSNQLPSTPRFKLTQPPQYTSPVTPNKINNKYLPILYQKAESLANIINKNSNNSFW